MSETLRRVQALVLSGDYRVSDHGFNELEEDDIVASDLIAGVPAASAVEDYRDRVRGPECPSLAARRRGPAHSRGLGDTGRPTPPCYPGHSLSARSGFVGQRFQTTDKTMTRKRTKLIHEGKYAAEVQVELIEDDTAWSPYLSPEDVRRLDAVRLALRRGDLAEAAKHGRVYELKPVAAE